MASISMQERERTCYSRQVVFIVTTGEKVVVIVFPQLHFSRYSLATLNLQKSTFSLAPPPKTSGAPAQVKIPRENNN